MPTLFKRSNSWRWNPDADPVGAPDGALLRAENTIPDSDGSRVLRRGSSTVYSGLVAQRVGTLHSPVLRGVRWRLAGIDNDVYRNGEPFGFTFAGRGDISIGDDAYQAFFARGSTKKKFDGTSSNNWGIAAPTYKPSLAAVNAITTQVATFDNGESPAFTIHEGSSNFVDNYDGDTEEALELIPNATTGLASASKVFSSDTDYLDIGGGIGSHTDLFDIRSWFQNPRKVDKVRIMFGLGTGDDPFLDDFYYFDFDFRKGEDVNLKDPVVNAVEAHTASSNRLLNVLTPEEVTSVRSPEQAGRIVKRLTSLRGSFTTGRQDTQQNSPAWGHLSVTRGQFKRSGKTSGRSWKTVRGFKIVYSVVPGSQDSIYVDDAIWTGGGSRSLTGTFKVGYRYARRLLDENGAEIYTELSPMSPISDDIILAQQTLQVTIPASALTAKDAQVDTIWVYLYGGWLDTYYRVAITSAAPSGGMTIEDLSARRSGSTDFDQKEERSRLASLGFSYPEDSSSSDDLTVSIFKSELEALSDNEPFEPGSVGPPNNIIGIAGPWRKRMFALTSEGWLYISSGKRPSSFSVYHTIDLRRYGTPYWVIYAGEHIFVGTSKDIIRIEGSGNIDPDTGVLLDLYPREMGVGNPPVDESAGTDGSSILYRSGDGPMLFGGVVAQPIPFAGTSFLWKGRSRHGVSELDTKNGRFRFEVDNHNLYMLAPEGEATEFSVSSITFSGTTATVTLSAGHSYSTGDQIKISGASEEVYNGVFTATVTAVAEGESNTTFTYTMDDTPEANAATATGQTLKAVRQTDPTSVWKYMPNMEQWARFTYKGSSGASVRPLSIFREYDGTLLMGVRSGQILSIEEEDSGDSGSSIPVLILTPIDDGGNPVGRKDAADLQIHCNTGGSPGTALLLPDGTSSETPVEYTFTGTENGIYRTPVTLDGPFLRMQIQFSGSFTEFSLQAFGLTYRQRPQQVMRLDLGHIIPPNGGDLSWVNEVEIDTYSPADLQMKIYKGGSLFDTLTVPVTAGIRDVYTVVCPRGTKDRRLQIVFETTNDAGEENPGFEPYGVKVRHAGSGNATELSIGGGDGGNV